MIGKVTRGGRVGGLLRYLFGPGRHNEHLDPHLVAAWDDPTLLEPGAVAGGRRDTAALAGLLEQPLLALGGRRPDRAVWHCSVRTAPADRVLPDGEWADVAGDILARAGFAPGGDADGCRWVAVRHADDHVHLVVTLARQDGRPAAPRNDFYRVGEACRAAEHRLGLRQTAPRDRTAERRPTRGEGEKARRAGRAETARAVLRREVRAAAAATTDPETFVDRLRDAGLLVRERHSETTPGQVTGYAVALPGDTSGAGSPIWFGGGKLATDLTLPKLRHRWGIQPAAATEDVGRPRLSEEQRRAVWAQAQRTAADAAGELRRLAGVDPAGAADVAWAASDALAVAARVAEGRAGGPLTKAADDFDRAGRQAWGRTPTPTTAGAGLRSLARLLATTGRARRDETTQLLGLVLNLLALVEATGRLRETQQRAAQAAAALSAARQLRDTAAALTPAGRAPAPVATSMGRPAPLHPPDPPRERRPGPRR